MKTKRKKIFIAVILLLLILIVSALTYSYFAGKSAAKLIAQHGTMVILKMQIYAYEEKYDTMPKNLEVMQLPSLWIKNLNIKYPDDKYLFYEKEPRTYGFKKGRFFVYKDGFIKFIPTGESPPERRLPQNILQSTVYFDMKLKNIKYEKYYDKGMPTKIIAYYRTGAKKSQKLYKDGKKHGEFITWNKNGTVLEIKYYQNGVELKKTNSKKKTKKDNKATPLNQNSALRKSGK